MTRAEQKRQGSIKILGTQIWTGGNRKHRSFLFTPDAGAGADADAGALALAPAAPAPGTFPRQFLERS